ncbi:MerR family transcriptional regulator [Streptomyces sp. NPDC057705]|uniref:MerR family transcriptional regulator n=1 Tax=Streptomyces sp. NPDC057705 TaxID=3346222 RepID=UPI0036BF3413
MSALRISQLAGLSGVPASTLRFYETAGLLSAERTASGHRQYGREAVDRLAFISSGKLLGLALEDIRALLDVRDAGACAAVRERMLPMVADRIADADRRATRLAAFSAHLAEVHRELAGDAPAGGCGPRLRLHPAPGPGQVLVDLSPTRPPDVTDEPRRQSPVGCTLDGAELAERTGQWRALVAQAGGREVIDGGPRLHFPGTPQLAGELASPAAAEQGCCAFFDFTLDLAPDRLTLTVRAPEAAGALMADLFAAAA